MLFRAWVVLWMLALVGGNAWADELSKNPEPGCAPEVKTIGKGESYESRYYVYKGTKPGPTILLEAGIHGNEPAGTHALEKLRKSLCVKSGTVVLYPAMHPKALSKKRRYYHKDLNKVFPGKAKSRVLEERLAAEIYALVKRLKPDLVVTLHEARRHYGKTGKCCAHTIIYGIDKPTDGLKKTADLVNERAKDKMDRFHLYRYPVDNSSSEIFVRDFGLEAYCVESWLRHPMKRRIAAHLNVVTAFLEAYGIEFSWESPY